MQTFLTEQVALDSLNPDPLNPRTMPETEMAALMRSLTEFGAVQPIVARRADHLVIGGHQRLEAARRLGWATVPVLWWEGDDRAARALNLALNRIGGEWAPERLGALLAELADVDSLQDALHGFDPRWTDLAGFDAREVVAALETALGTVAPVEDLAALARDLAAPARAAPRTRPGQGYQLGAHRVLCADARDRAAVEALCAGAPPALLFTDPPYNVAYRPEAGPDGAASSGRSTGRRAHPLGSIAGDDLDEAAYAGLIESALGNAAAVLAPGAAVYVCGGSTTTSVYDRAFAAAGLVKSAILVWDKGRFSFGRRDYQSQVELITYGWKRGAAHRFFGGRAQSDLWLVPPDAGAVYVHPTQKPVALAARAMRNSTAAGSTILDLFGGSGSTLIAAEQTGRRACLLECDPHYVDVIVARWEACSGRRAEPFDPASAAPASAAAASRA